MGFAEVIQSNNKWFLAFILSVGTVFAVICAIFPKGHEYFPWIAGGTALITAFMLLRIWSQKKLIDHLRDHPEDDPYMDGYCL